MTHLLFAEGNFLEVISVNFWQMIISILNLVILYLILFLSVCVILCLMPRVR